MPTNPYEAPREVSERPKDVDRPRRTKKTLATIATTTLIGLLSGIALACSGILLLPSRSTDKRTVYDWSFLLVMTVFAGLVIGLIAGIGRALDDREA